MLPTYAQPYETNPDFNRTRNWHFGYGVGLRFDPDTVYVVPSNIQISEATTVLTDTNGSLLLYSNGEKIWNANHEVIHNGNLALGHNSSKLGSIFVFHEDNPDNIFLFNTNYSLSAKKELSFNLLVREADTFRTVFKDSVLRTGMSEPIAVVKADNGKDIWIVTHVFNGNRFIVYRLTEEGLVTCPHVVEARTFTGSQYFEAQFQMVFSSDGKYLMKVNEQKIELFSFNNRDGIMEMLYSIGSLNAPVLGICFAPNGKNIFVAERDYDLSVYKFNPLDSFTTVSSKKIIPLEGFKFTLGNMPFEHGIALVRVDTFSYLDFIVNVEDFDSIALLEKRINLNSYIGAILPNFNQSYFHTPSINFTDRTHSTPIAIVGKSANKAQRPLPIILKPL